MITFNQKPLITKHTAKINRSKMMLNPNTGKPFRNTNRRKKDEFDSLYYYYAIMYAKEIQIANYNGEHIATIELTEPIPNSTYGDNAEYCQSGLAIDAYSLQLIYEINKQDNIKSIAFDKGMLTIISENESMRNKLTVRLLFHVESDWFVTYHYLSGLRHIDCLDDKYQQQWKILVNEYIP